MRFIRSALFSTAAFASLALAQLKITGAPTNAIGGKQYVINFSGGDGSPATLTLRKGPSNNLKVITVLTQSATDGSFTWSVDPGLVTANDYALQVTEGSQTNYWAVSITGTGTGTGTGVSLSTSFTEPSLSLSTGSSSSSGSSPSIITPSSSFSNTTGTAATSGRPVSGGSSTIPGYGSKPNSSHPAGSGSAPNAGNNLQSNAALVLGAIAGFAFLG